MDRTPAFARNQALVYDGRIGELYSIFLLNLLFTILTLGIFRFWAITRYRRYFWARMRFQGERFEYTGTGGELFVGYLLAGLVLAWRAVIAIWGIPQYLVPGPASVLAAAVAHAGVLLARAGYTLGSALLGLGISGVFAVALSLAFTGSRRLAQASLPLVVAFRSAPVTAIAPLIMLMVGRGVGTSVIVVTIVSFFPLYVNLMRGLAAPDRNAVELMRVTGATRWQQLRYVRIPYAMPFLFTGLRVAGGSAILGAMLSEWLTGAPGLGMLILSSGDLREVELLWAATILSVLVALGVFWATSAAERALLGWRR